LAQRNIRWSIRAGPHTPVRAGNIMLGEMGAGNVGLTNAEMSAMADHIENYWGLPDGLLRLKEKTITLPTDLKPRICEGKFLFKELLIQIKNKTNSTSLTATVRDFILRVEAWNKL